MKTKEQMEKIDAELAEYLSNSEPQNSVADEVLTAIEDYIAAGSTELGLQILSERLAYLKQHAYESISRTQKEERGDIS